MKPSTVTALKAVTVMLPALPALDVLSMFAVSAPPSVTETALLAEVRVMFPALPVELLSMEPATVTFSPAPLAERVMLPPVPPVVELSMAKVRLFALLETLALPSAPVMLMLPPVPVERLSTTPSTEASSAAARVMLPPLPPAVELRMSPRTAALAAPTMTSLLVDVMTTLPAVVVDLLSMVPSTLEEPVDPPEEMFMMPPEPLVVLLSMAGEAARTLSTVTLEFTEERLIFPAVPLEVLLTVPSI